MFVSRIGLKNLGVFGQEYSLEVLIVQPIPKAVF